MAPFQPDDRSVIVSRESKMKWPGSSGVSTDGGTDAAIVSTDQPRQISARLRIW